MDKLIQYIIVRGDLSKTLSWPVGAVIAQCCHATTAVGHLYRDDPETQEYYSDLDNMHKVVLEVIMVIISSYSLCYHKIFVHRHPMKKL